MSGGRRLGKLCRNVRQECEFWLFLPVDANKLVVWPSRRTTEEYPMSIEFSREPSHGFSFATRTAALVAVIGLALALAGAASADPCVVTDNGSGTVTLPPAGCEYLSPTDVHMIIDGLPPGTTIRARTDPQGLHLRRRGNTTAAVLDADSSGSVRSARRQPGRQRRLLQFERRFPADRNGHPQSGFSAHDRAFRSTRRSTPARAHRAPRCRASTRR